MSDTAMAEKMPGDVMVRQRTLREELMGRRKRLMAEVDSVDKAISVMDKNPGVEQAIDAIGEAMGTRILR